MMVVMRLLVGSVLGAVGRSFSKAWDYDVSIAPQQLPFARAVTT